MEFDGIGECATRHIRHRVRRLMGRFGFTESDREDLEQDLAADLLRRKKNFNPARATYRTFATRVIDHRIATLAAQRMAASRDYRRNGFSLNEFVEDEEGHLTVRYALLNEKSLCTGQPLELADLAIETQQAISRLPARLQKVCRCLMTMTPYEVVRELGIPKSTLYRDIAAIRKALAEAGIAEYLGRPESRGTDE